MTERHVLEPTAEHPITITPTAGRVVVRVDGAIVADSCAALTLQESTYPAVQYIPLRDVDGQRLRHSQTTTYCPYKGEAGYYSVAGARVVVDDALWCYERPYPAVAAIAGHVAFYPDKADISVTPD
ncbi:DUF427 domain-containing protein [[Mycobacterium] wendilense]|uniref:DUF427 domain-containing protein n=1 Tax=[Mycobacterium] wendilense TaxID=3064284 RepID=A0ABN9P426_9MYCO|nr:DUF427 domain-containing protein [Mycolicibacterium sp. MU0050]CAJ1586608.1 DUF427 domain-containing protein [Mycolicibacterium sp. MU0050]